MHVEDMRLDRPFRDDSNYPTEFSTGADTCLENDGESRPSDSALGEAGCRSCNAAPSPNGAH